MEAAPKESAEDVADEGLVQVETTKVVEPVAAAIVAAPEAPVIPAAEPVPAAPTGPTPTGVAEIDTVASVLSKAGATDVNAAMAELLKDGAMSLTTKARLMSEGDPAVVQMAITQAEQHVTQVRAAKTAAGQAVREHAAKALGVEASAADSVWQTVGAFFNSGAFTAEEQASINKMLTSEDTGRFAVNEIVTRMKNDPGFVQPATLISGGAPTATGFEPVSKADYLEQIGPAIHKYGEDSREVRALRARRMTTVKRGM